MSIGLTSISDIEPSDSMLYRSFQMISECAYRFVELFWKTIPSNITYEGLEKKLANLREVFKSDENIAIEEPFTPREAYLLRKDDSFKSLRNSEALQTIRERITSTIPKGVSIFVTSRLTARLMQEQRFNLAEVFRYIGGRDLKHIGFIINEGGDLSISHVDPEKGGIRKIDDPLFFMHTAIFRIDFSSVLPAEDAEKIQKVFNDTVLLEASKPRGEIPSMGAWVVLPFFLGHKRLWGDSSKIELREDVREMCSSFVAKVLLTAFKAAKTLNPSFSNEILDPIPPDEILERIHIVRFFHFFAPYLQGVSFPDQVANAFPSPTPKVMRFLRKEA